MRRTIEGVVLCAAMSLAAGLCAQPATVAEQRVFHSADATMKHPVPLPLEVNAVLAKNPAVQAALAKAGLGAGKLPDGWFTASAIHTESGVVLLVVEAERPLFDEYETAFWIFERADAGYAELLEETGRELEIAAEGAHPGVRVTREHYHIYPSTSFRWKDGHYAQVIVK